VKGWAINCRINAEDPRRNFTPSPGLVSRYQAPAGPGIRIDSALFSGYVIPEYYDSMVAKLATWGRNRKEAIERMRVALDEIQIVGVPTTIPLHQTIMWEERFNRGEFDTSYLGDIMPLLNSHLAALERYAVVAAVAAKMRNQTRSTEPPRHEGISRWRMAGSTGFVARNRTW
jgi:acetyl-CoA carboxylase biotin carboxylase subunit